MSHFVGALRHDVVTVSRVPIGRPPEENFMNRQIAGWIAHRWAKWVTLGRLTDLHHGHGHAGSQAHRRPGERHRRLAARRRRVDQGHPEVGSVLRPGQRPCRRALRPRLGHHAGRHGQGHRPTPRRSPRSSWSPTTSSARSRPRTARRSRSFRRSSMDEDGWDKLPDAVEDIRKVAEKDAGGLDVKIAGPAALGADQAKAFAGIDGILLLVGARRGRRPAAADLPQPRALADPVDLWRCQCRDGPRLRLRAGQGLRAHRQRPERRRSSAS